MANAAEFHLTDTIALLARTPATLNALLRDLPGLWICGTEGPDTWNAPDILGHLVHGERTDWMPRVRILLEHGEARPFTPFDRFAQRKISLDRTCGQLLDEFAALRSANLTDIENLNLQPEDLTRTGLHPALGVVRLSQLLATWAVHDLTHLHQLTRVMARQYRDQVGPWSAYLGVLHCDGHSAP